MKPAEYFSKNLFIYKKNFEFIDSVDLTTIPYFLEEANICMFPAKWDNFPYVCLEALNYRKVVIASKNSGMSEMIIDNNTGMLIDLKKEKKAINRIIDLIKDKHKQNVIKNNLKNYIEKYNNSELIIESVEKLYKSVLK